MALSNIAREPRREITESMVGIVIVGVLLWADYGFAVWLEGLAGQDGNGGANCPWPIGILIGVFVLAGCVFMVFMTHALGETVCDRLQDAGVHLRPRRRPPPNVTTITWTPMPSQVYSAPVKEDKGR